MTFVTSREAPAVFTVFFGINISLGKHLFHIVIKCAVVKIAHLVLLMADKLMTWVNISLRSNSDIFVSAAAASQTFYCAWSLIQINHKVEEIIILPFFS